MRNVGLHRRYSCAVRGILGKSKAKEEQDKQQTEAGEVFDRLARRTYKYSLSRQARDNGQYWEKEEALLRRMI